MIKKVFVFSMVLIALALSFTGCKSNEDATPISTNISISDFTVTAERDDLVQGAQAKMIGLSAPQGNSEAGYVYFLNLNIHETAGNVAILNRIEFSFYADGVLFGSYGPDISSVFGNNQVSPNASISADEKIVSSDPEYPYADEVKVEITYQDTNGTQKTTSSTVQSPSYADADIILLEDTIEFDYLFNFPMASGILQNVGNKAARYITIVLRFYNSAGELVNLAMKDLYDTDLAELSAGATVHFNATTSYVLDWSKVSFYSWQTQWTTVDGTTSSNSGEVSVK